jgi:hypothetical protein
MFFLFKKYSGASTIFATIKPARHLPIFVFDSSRVNLEKTVLDLKYLKQ